MGLPSYTDSDDDLVVMAQHGDKAAFSELVRRHSESVINLVFRLCGNIQLAEDAAQESFVQAWLKLSSYRPQTSLRNWLYRIAVNMSIDALRREKHLSDQELSEQLVAAEATPEVLLTRQERAQNIQEAVLALPPACRAVLVLRIYEELSYQEIAGVLDIPLGTVMSRLNYARMLLRKTLEPQLWNPVEVEHV